MTSYYIRGYDPYHKTLYTAVPGVYVCIISSWLMFQYVIRRSPRHRYDLVSSVRRVHGLEPSGVTCEYVTDYARLLWRVARLVAGHRASLRPTVGIHVLIYQHLHHVFTRIHKWYQVPGTKDLPVQHMVYRYIRSVPPGAYNSSNY